MQQDIYVYILQKRTYKIYCNLKVHSSPFPRSFFVLIGCIRYIFASLFLCFEESTCEIRKNAFYFTLKRLFVPEIIKC